MPPSALSALVTRLNLQGKNRLPDMWELVFLDALGQVVDMTHEQPLETGTRPDFQFHATWEGEKFSVVGDITTVSDAGIIARNPYEALSRAIHDRAVKEGLHGGGFHLEVAHEEIDKKDGRRVQLAIPTGPELEQLVSRVIRPFVEKVARNPHEPEYLVVDEPDARFSVRYNGPSDYSGGSYRSFDSALSATNNPIYTQLKAKAKQLRGAQDKAIRLLIVCDGNSSTMSKSSPIEGFSARRIAERFLKETKSVDLVFLVSVDSKNSELFSNRRELSMRYELVAAPPAYRASRVTEAALAAIISTLQSSVERVPKPKMTPLNAARRNVDSTTGEKMPYSIVWSEKQVKISARTLHELLSGAITQDEFLRIHNWKTEDENVFRVALNSGRLLSSASIEHEDDQDDDWVVFRFGDPDPSISPFRAIKK